MSPATQDVAVPDIGDFTDIPIIEVLVAVGDTVEVEQGLVEIESDKATFEVPSPVAGVVEELRVAVGDKVSEGVVIAVIEPARGDAVADDAEGGGEEPAKAAVDVEEQAEDKPAAQAGDNPAAQAGDNPAARAGDNPAARASDSPAGQAGATSGAGGADEASGPEPLADAANGDIHAQVLVLGSGPGGYSAAFRAADLGLEVVLVERYPTLGGVCLNVGCIPSKALLHQAKIIAEAEESAGHGITFGDPQIDLDALRSYKDEVVGKLTGGVDGMAKRRKVTVVTGEGTFTDDRHLTVTSSTDDGDAAGGVGSEGGGKQTVVSFDHAIIAAGSSVVKLPGIPYDDPRVWDSTAALELREIPDRLLVIGGGIIGLEMATVYDALGSKVTVVELSDGLIPGCDRDLVKPLQARIAKRYEAIHTGVKVEAVEAKGDGLHVTFARGGGGGDDSQTTGDAKGAAGADSPVPEPQVFDAVLVSVGRSPNGKLLGLDRAGVHVDERGFVPVDDQLRTNVPHILAIGDLVGGPMLAHKASHEAHVAAEVIAGEHVAFDVRGIPSVAYTDPEVAWVGLTETQAKADGTPYVVAAFPWAASGRALAIDGAYGRTKLLVDPESRQILGAGIVGPGAGELIAEPGFAMEMGAEAGDLALTVHAHPTLSESVMLAAEMLEGTITDLPPQRRRTR